MLGRYKMESYKMLDWNQRKQKQRRKKNKCGELKKKTDTNIVDINPTKSVITLNANGLSTQIKAQRLSEWIKNQDPTECCLQETHFKC